MKIRDRENRKILTGFRDMADFVMGNRDPISPLVGPLVDRFTVIGYVHKKCCIFKPYKRIRVSEIQSSYEFVNERLSEWTWVAGADNPADLSQNLTLRRTWLLEAFGSQVHNFIFAVG